MPPRLSWQPVGPLPAAVYWRRRAGVLTGLLLLLLLLAELLPGGGDDPVLQQAGPSARPAASPGASPAPSASPVEVTACAPQDLRVQADTAPAEVVAARGAQVRVAVTNTSGATCSVRLGEAAVELLVLSGSDRIWSSDDCADSAADDDGRVDLQPGERRLLTRAWDGRRSRPGCPGGGEVARPGTYRVLARVGAVQQEGRAFRVR